MRNTYGIVAVNETVYNYMKFACFMPNGCLDQISYCRQTNRSSAVDFAICSEAQNMCRDNVEGPYYQFSGRGVYDIRHPYDDPEPPQYFIPYLNLPSTQQALGVNLNYTRPSNYEIFFNFQRTGDFVYPDFIEDLQMLLSKGVRVNLGYGDSDYICNWYVLSLFLLPSSLLPSSLPLLSPLSPYHRFPFSLPLYSSHPVIDLDNGLKHIYRFGGEAGQQIPISLPILQ